MHSTPFRCSFFSANGHTIGHNAANELLALGKSPRSGLMYNTFSQVTHTIYPD